MGGAVGGLVGRCFPALTGEMEATLGQKGVSKCVYVCVYLDVSVSIRQLMMGDFGLYNWGLVLLPRKPNSRAPGQRTLEALKPDDLG